MKKMLSLSLAALMLLALMAGCGGDKTPPAEGGDKKTDKVQLTILDTSYVEEEYAICVAKENTELLDKINKALTEMKDEGTTKKIVDYYISGTPHDLKFQENATGKPELHMATNAAFPPYEFFDGEVIVGIDADMARAIADKLDMKLVIDNMDFDPIVTAVQTGKADMGMAALSVTPDRLQNVSFSDTYAKGVQSIIVPVGSDIKTPDDLSADGAKYLIGTQKGTTGASMAEEGFGSDRVMPFPAGPDAIQALITGKVDCIIIDNEPAKAFVEANNK